MPASRAIAGYCILSLMYFPMAASPPGNSAFSSTTKKISGPTDSVGPSLGGAINSLSPSWSIILTLASFTSSCNFCGSSSTASSLITGGVNLTSSTIGGGGGGGGGGGVSSIGGGGVKSICTTSIFSVSSSVFGRSINFFNPSKKTENKIIPKII